MSFESNQISAKTSAIIRIAAKNQRSPTIIQFFVFVLVCIAVPIAETSTQSTQAGERVKTRSLDQLLLEELNEGLLEGLKDISQDIEDSESASSKKRLSDEEKSPDGLDVQLLDALGEKEDIRLRKSHDPIVGISHRMFAAARRIAAKKTADDTQQIQQGILDELDALLKQTARNKKPQDGDSTENSAVNPRESIKQPKPSPKTRQSRENPKPQDSDERLDPQYPRPVNMGDIEILFKEDLWGHLPRRAREKLLKTHVDQFLPEYEELIIDYYKRLAEED